VIGIETRVDPDTLFKKIKAIEKEAGRRSETIRFGPRVLDLDILLFRDLVLETDCLTIPHPRMHQRRFVLQPICDIAPGVVHPVLKQTMQQLLESLSAKGQKVVLYP
jgi:2-amino-4-hydroxy-6-hydroxymethyldihydropteridine diphosphokinase